MENYDILYKNNGKIKNIFKNEKNDNKEGG